MSGHGHDLDRPRVEEVADRVFAFIQPDGTWFINNAGFLVADDGVVAVDTCSTERRTRAFLDSLAGVTSAPVRTLVNTHHHGDHTNVNYLTHPATIVAHENCRELMVASGIRHHPGVFEQADWGDLELVPPTVTFAERVNLWVGATRDELHHIGGAAHTTNDVVAWVPERRVLFTGDLVFNGGTPFVVMGSVSGSLTTIERVRSFDAEVIVAGHGQVCTPFVLDAFAAYLRFVQDAAAEARSAGIGALEAARSLDPGRFAELTDTERIVGNLHSALYELDGGPEGGPMDIVAAIGDMVTYNGGRPLRCLARRRGRGRGGGLARDAGRPRPTRRMIWPVAAIGGGPKRADEVLFPPRWPNLEQEQEPTAGGPLLLTTTRHHLRQAALAVVVLAALIVPMAAPHPAGAISGGSRPPGTAVEPRLTELVDASSKSVGALDGPTLVAVDGDSRAVPGSVRFEVYAFEPGASRPAGVGRLIAATTTDAAGSNWATTKFVPVR